MVLDQQINTGQITTLWHDIYEQAYQSTSTTTPHDELTNSLQSNFHTAQVSLQTDIFPIEQSMQNLYNGRIANRSRQPSHHNKNNNNRRGTLTKKQVPKIASQSSSNPEQLEELLRNLLKVGEDRSSRMVDSALATDYLYSDYSRGGMDETFVRRIVGAQVLTEDAVSGGRFKRRSCQFVAAQYSQASSAEEQRDVEEITLVNGGWIAVDPSTKASTEGRMAGQKFAAASNNIDESNEKAMSAPFILTAADERIAHRLECLAMGDDWSKNDEVSNLEGEEDDRMLELDVREALTSMNLPLTPKGATDALIKIGRWSSKSAANSKKQLIEPWSPELLDAARSLAMYEDKRRDSLARECYATDKKKGSTKIKSGSFTDGLEGRVDLTSLPCVCIDAKRASFRDDSIGIRLRSSTGRKVNKAASKWEILVHIADVSDIYFEGLPPHQQIKSRSDVNRKLLRQAAESRGQSRYDLPLGKGLILVRMLVLLNSLALAHCFNGHTKSQVHFIYCRQWH